MVKRGAHEWIIEFAKNPTDLTKFEELLDQHLREVNSDYDAKRHKDLALVKPIIHIAENGLFQEWLRQKGKLGGQNKVPRLSNSREFVEELLKIKASLKV